MSENLLKGIAEPLHFIAVGQGNSFKFSQAVFCLGGGDVHVIARKRTWSYDCL